MTSTMKSYKSELTGSIYVGDKSAYYNEHEDVTQLYIGEALVQEISGFLEDEEIEEYFNDYYIETLTPGR